MTLSPDASSNSAPRRLPRTPTALLAAGTLSAAFAVADVSGVRPLGGVVLVAGGLWCCVRSRRAGWWRVTGVVVLAVALFVASHLLAPMLGAWPAVLLAAAVLGAVTYGLVDRDRDDAQDAAPGGSQHGEPRAVTVRGSRGMRATERLVTVFGPAQVGDPTTPLRPVTGAELARDRELQASLERVVGPDGGVYLVERGSTPRPPA